MAKHGEWYVTDHDGVQLPGAWATEEAAREEGLGGRYLLSGLDVWQVPSAEFIAQVEESLRRAADNGYHFIGWTTREIAIDMADTDPDLEAPEDGDDGAHVEKLEVALRHTIDYKER